VAKDKPLMICYQPTGDLFADGFRKESVFVYEQRYRWDVLRLKLSEDGAIGV